MGKNVAVFHMLLSSACPSLILLYLPSNNRERERAQGAQWKIKNYLTTVALCGTEQQLCETEQLHSANTQMAKQISPLSTNHVTYSPRAGGFIYTGK